MHQLVALFFLGMVVFVYTYARLVRRAWPPGHPWSGLAWLLLGAGGFMAGNPETRGLNIRSGLYFVLGILMAIIWLYDMQSKPRGK
jgi:4-hydroxybenzoate polyprenyltransferase